ncbi:MAG: TlpA family protein disulfide reductase [Acidimicrobiales bacterium]
MGELAIAAGIVVAVLVVAFILRRAQSDAPMQMRKYSAPDQLDRADFEMPDAKWLLVVFSSETCRVCKGVLGAVAPLASDEICVQEVEFVRDSGLHERYGIDAVPTLVLADETGLVRYSALGPQKAAELWIAVSDVVS